MTGDMKIIDKDGNMVNGRATSAMMPLKFEIETSFGGKTFKLMYSHSRDAESRRDMDKIKGIVLTGS